MCGIIGIISNDNVTDKLFKGLRKLEYRGYDSSGIATINNSAINCIKSEGNLNQLEKKLINVNLPGNIGIGHTRWATHGVANEVNAHPHITDEVAIVHNGIIENYSLLKNQITANGIDFTSDTDTEAIAHLLTTYLNSGMDSYSAIRATTQDIKGTYALVVLIKSDPDKLYAVRKGSPLAIGFTEDEMFVGSDAYSLGNLSNEVIFLQDDDVAVLERNSYQIYDISDQQIHRKSQKLEKSLSLSDKGAFKHFMAKEIHEQPDVIFDSIHH